MKRASFLFAVLATACSPVLTFHDTPVVWRVADDADIPEPEEREFHKFSHYADMLVMDSVDRTLSLADEERAQDINAIDEVPDSSWFENRIGRYDLTPDDITHGPGGDPPVLPLVITKGKAIGSNPGFLAKDASGRKFLIKLDLQPEMQTGAAAIASRILWAAGYHAPTEHVFSFSLDEISIDPKATYDEGIHEDLPYTDETFRKVLDRAPPPVSGRYRALSSELLNGKPKGGWSDNGLRSDDPNDTIPHEHRRSLRALHAFGSWIDHTDISILNTLDVYVEEDNRKFLRHYLVDFGETLGSHAYAHGWIGYAYVVDLEVHFLSLLTLGLWKRPWEDRPKQIYPSVGPYLPHVDVRNWKENKPYYAFRERTDADMFWAAKIIMRFRRPHIQAAVATAKLSDPAAARYLVEAISSRRDDVGFTYMTPVTALDHFVVTDDQLCMVDLSALYDLAQGGVVEQRLDGELVGRYEIGLHGEVCMPKPAGEGYVRYRLQTVRRDQKLEPIELHVWGGATARVLGVVRDW